MSLTLPLVTTPKLRESEREETEENGKNPFSESPLRRGKERYEIRAQLIIIHCLGKTRTVQGGIRAVGLGGDAGKVQRKKMGKAEKS